jgi:hypothetical protein
MRDFLLQLAEIINLFFGVLELLTVRLTLLGLSLLGAYQLLRRSKTH